VSWFLATGFRVQTRIHNAKFGHDLSVINTSTSPHLTSTKGEI